MSNNKIPTETDCEFQARIRELEGQVGNLQQQLQKQQQSQNPPIGGGVGPPVQPTLIVLHLVHRQTKNHTVLQPKPHRLLPLQVKTCDNCLCNSALAPTLTHLISPARPPSCSHRRKVRHGLLLTFQQSSMTGNLKPGLTLNDRKMSELQDWLKQVEDWVEAQEADDFLTKIRRTAVIWGIPPGTVTKLQKHPVGKLIAVGSYMER